MATGDVLFASRVFRWAAIYGLISLAPLYLLPLPALEPHIRLGFIGVALAFQWVFWVIGDNPRHYRTMMLPAVAEKLVFGLPALALVALGRTPGLIAGFALVDLALGLAFFVAWRRTSPS